MTFIPRSSYMKGRIFDRGKFLNGTYKSYFGPGQGPETILNYAPPTEWNGINTLLDLPQVVWLILAVSDRSTPQQPEIYPLYFCSRKFSGEFFPAPGITDLGDPYNTQYFITQSPIVEQTIPYEQWSVVLTGQFDPTDPYYTQVQQLAQDAMDQTPPAFPYYEVAYMHYQDITKARHYNFYANGTLTTTCKDITITEPGGIEATRLALIYEEVKRRTEFKRPGKTFVNILNYSYVPVGENGNYTPLRPDYPNLGENNYDIYGMPKSIPFEKDQFLGLNLQIFVVQENAGVLHLQTAIDDLKITLEKLGYFELNLYKPSTKPEDLSFYKGVNPKNPVLSSTEGEFHSISEDIRDYIQSVWDTIDSDLNIASEQGLAFNGFGYTEDMTADQIIDQIARFYNFNPDTGLDLK